MANWLPGLPRVKASAISLHAANFGCHHFRMKTFIQKALFIAVVLVFAGCVSNPGIVKLSPDTFMLSRTDRAGGFGNPSAMKAEVIREANQFAESQGKVAIPLSSNEIPMGVARFASFEYQFRVVDKDDSEARRTSLVPRADVTIENKTTGDPTAKQWQGSDLYSELTKLDDLRKKGIITDAEFAEQKQKLLSK